MAEALGREVYHYHLHVVYVPVVEKQILWSKRSSESKNRISAYMNTINNQIFAKTDVYSLQLLKG